MKFADKVQKPTKFALSNSGKPRTDDSDPIALLLNLVGTPTKSERYEVFTAAPGDLLHGLLHAASQDVRRLRAHSHDHWDDNIPSPQARRADTAA